MKVQGRLKKELQGAVSLYRSFRERKPRRVKTVTVKLPKAVACIGYLEYVGYRTTHGSKVELYQHDFSAGSRPLLCVSADGKQILLLGGRYHFTDRGIVDLNHRGQEIEEPNHGELLQAS